MKIIIASSTKFWAFNMAEQFEKGDCLHTLYTSYASTKNSVAKKFVSRVDKEKVTPEYIKTIVPLAVMLKYLPRYSYYWNDAFDFWVSKKISKVHNFDLFIGWSGMALRSIRSAKKNGKITILERASSHILFQNQILKEEYSKYGIDFNIDQRVIQKELLEYQESDYINVPSDFVRDSLIEYGISKDKIIKNQFGVSNHFNKLPTILKKFTIVYLGTLSIRKGLIYLFEALKSLSIPTNLFEVKFVGHIAEDVKPIISKYQMDNWTFTGHVNHYQISTIIAGCDIAVHPSVEEGLSMVIIQLLACGIPVVATTNTGGLEIIRDNYNGYIVPIRNIQEIADRIEKVFNDKQLLEDLKINAVESVKNGFTWNDYGNRWKENITKILL